MGAHSRSVFACEGVRVLSSGDPELRRVTAVWTSDRRIELEASREDEVAELRPVLCADLTGDGFPELIVDFKREGAHCCHLHRVFELKSGRLLLEFPEGHGGGGLQRAFQEDGCWSLVGTSGVFLEEWFERFAHADPFFSLPYAQVPRPPIYFDWDGRAYRVATREFFRQLEELRTLVLIEQGLEQPEGLLLYIALSVEIGDWKSAREHVKKSPRLSQLDRIAAALHQRLAPSQRHAPRQETTDKQGSPRRDEIPRSATGAVAP